MAVNIVLLGASCELITEHRRTLDEKVTKTLGGQSASLPASRHNSVTDLTILDEEQKFLEIKEKMIEQASPSKHSTKAPVSLNSGARSTPHSPSTSPHNSLKDITKQVAIAQNTLDSSIILSDSTVSLVSMNDGHNLKLPDVAPLQKENAIKQGAQNSPRRKLFSFSGFPSMKRRISLQELPNNGDLTYVENSNAKQQEGPSHAPVTKPKTS